MTSSEPVFLKPDHLKGLVFLPYGSGHLNPTLPLIQELVEKEGHHLVVFNLPKNKERVEATGATFRRFPNGDDFTVENYCPPKTPFFLQLLYSSEILIPFVARMVKEEKPHYILHDYHFFWVRYVAELLNIPAVCVSPSMLGYLPVYDLVLRDERSEEVAQKLQTLYGAEVDLETVMTNYEECTLVFCSRYLQTDEEKYPEEAGFHFIGPQLQMRHGGLDPNSPVCARVEAFLSEPSSDEKKIVYMSMGSLYRPTQKFLTPFVEGISAIPGVLLVLNIGKALELEDVQDSFNYSNVVLVKWAPQLYLLEKASLFVTHSGMNSVVESSSFGCPMLLIPKFADQPTNAARVEELGAGIILSREGYAEADVIRNTVQTLLSSPQYQENAHKIALSLLHFSLSPSQLHSLSPSPLPHPSSLGKGGEKGARVVEEYVRKRLDDERKKGLVGVGGGVRGVLGGHIILAGTPKDKRRSSLDVLPSCEGRNEHPSCC